jgi:hypothetical protein
LTPALPGSERPLLTLADFGNFMFHIWRYTLAMDEDDRRKLVPGVRVRVTQQIAARHYSLSSVLEGVVTDYSQRETGSWFAHSKDEKLWLDRLTLRKDDGEITTLNLDDYSVVTLLGTLASPEEVKKTHESDLPV